jgi:hypothetical protein
MLKYAEYAEGRNMTRLGPFQNHPSTAAVPFWRRRQVFCAKVFADGTSEARSTSAPQTERLSWLWNLWITNDQKISKAMYTGISIVDR